MAFGQVVEPPGDFAGFIDWFKSALGTWAGAFAAILLLTEKNQENLESERRWSPDFIMGIIFTNIFYSFLLSNRNFRRSSVVCYAHICVIV